MSETIIYVLRLKESKFYIGRTNNLENRLLDHKSGKASVWTNKYPMIECIFNFVGEIYDEDKYVFIYMSKCGIENVRGGSYSNIDLTFEQHISIRRALSNANDTCLACNKKGHFIQNCKETICYRCGRIGHFAKECFCKTHSLGGSLNGCYTCGREDHWSYRCNKEKDIFGR